MARHVLCVQGHGEQDQTPQHELRRRGFSVHTEEDGQAGLAWAREHQPDLVWLASPDELCAAFKLNRATNALAVVQPWHTDHLTRLRVEPDSFFSRTQPGDDPLGWAVHRALAARDQRHREGTLAEVRFALPSDRACLEELTQTLSGWFARCGLTAHQDRQLNLALREVAANAIEWGHNNERHRIVWVSCRLDAEKISVLVRDSGPGFDPRNLPHAARPSDPLSHLKVRAERRQREGGFGILMASGLADHLCYNDTGNEAQLIKYLPRRVRRGAQDGPFAAPLAP